MAPLMWGQRHAARALVAVGILIAAGVPGIPGVESASSNPVQDYAESDIILTDTTWTGEMFLKRGVVVPAGRTLTIENATVKMNTTDKRHFGFNIDPLGKLVVRDSLLTNNQSWGTDFQKTEAYWHFFSKGLVDVQRSTIRHAGDISLEVDTARGSVLRDVNLYWLARGVHVMRTNLTNAPGWDLVMENVHIRDMPIVAGAGSADVGGAIGILNGDVRIRNVTIERARTTGLFIDRSAVSDDTDMFGNTVDARDLVVIAGSPPGMTGQGALAYVRTTGSFLCDQCAFVSPTPGGGLLMSDGHTIVLRDATLVDTALGVKLPATTNALFDGLSLRGPTAGIRYLYANQADPVFQGVSFDAAPSGGIFAERLDVQQLSGVWWGDASGPRDEDAEDGSIPATNAGAGRPVVGSIDYTGWLTTPPARPGLALALAPLPDAVPPGAVLSPGFTLTNTGETTLAVALRAAGLLAATPSLTSATLAPGESATGTLSFTVPATAAPATIVGVALLATADGQRAAAHASTLVGATVPRIRVDAPVPYQEIDGPFTVSGIVIEPTALPSSSSSPPPSSPSPSSPFVGGPPDANGDLVDDRAQLAPGRVSVILRHSGATEALRAAIEAAGGHVIRDFTLADLVWAFVPSSALATLAARDDVRDVWWDEPVDLQLAYAARTARARTSVGGILPGGFSPGVDYAGVWRGNPEEGYQGVTGNGVLVAVIDSGIDPTHASLDDMDDDPTTLDAKIAARISTFTILATEAADVAVSSVVFPGSHGTYVAGTAAGTGATFTGPVEAPFHGTTQDDPWMYAGVAPGARIVDIDAFEDTGEVTSQVPPVGFGLGTLAPNAGFGLALEGFEAVASWNRDHPEDPIRVVQISLSLGTTDVAHPFNEVANALAQTGVLIVVAVGNNHPGAVVPATASKVLAVGATKMFETVSRLDDGKAAFSDVSNAAQLAAGVRKPELMAPGSVVSMPRTQTLDAYYASEGTSFAAPVVSGVAALVFEANPALHAAQVKEILIRSSEPRGGASGQRYTDMDLDFEDDLEDGGWDPRWGYGYIDAEEAVRLARETTPRTPPEPPTLTLFAAGGELRLEPPSQSAVAFGEAQWDHLAQQALSVGDGDPETEETALVVLSAPSAQLGPSSHLVEASLYRDDTLVSRFTLLDDRISTSTAQEPLRLPLLLGKTAKMVLRGPDTGTIEITGTLAVLDEAGSLALDAGQTLRLAVEANHSGGVPAPIVTGPSGTHVTLRLDPRTLPNGAGPSAVSGTSADWNASAVTLRWGPAADDRGIASYQIVRDGELLATVSGSKHSYVDAVGEAETHRYRVRAVDLHGLVGPLGPEAHVETPPAEGRAVVVDIAGTSALATGASPWSAELSPLRVGRHQLRATLFDDGEAVGSQVVPVTLRSAANLPPVVELGALGGVLHGARSLAVSISDPNGDEDVVAREWRVDGGAWSPIAEGSIPLDAAALGPGAHALEARATDAANAQTVDALVVESVPWTAAVTAPAVLPDGVATTIGIAASGAGLTADALRLVGSGVAAFDVPVAPATAGFSALLPPLPSGQLRLEVRAGADVLVEATRVVDKPPVAMIVAPDTDGSRLDTILLVDASTDDSGFAGRLWTLPDGTTSTERIVPFRLANVTVGDHVVALAVTNINGLTDDASVAIHVEDLAPTIVASPFRLTGAPVTVAYTGETIALGVNVTDPENDPLVVSGGLTIDGVLLPVGPGLTNLTAQPQLAGTTLALGVTASDAWKTTTLSRSIPVHANTPPIAALYAPPKVDAGRSTWLDARASRDPDRALVSHVIEVTGLGTWATDRTLVVFPMGAWPVSVKVVDTSGAQATNATTVLADDWIAMRLETIEAPSALSAGALRVVATWHDGLPVADAHVELVASHGYLGLERTVNATTNATGHALLSPGTDLPMVNAPGPHDLRVTVRHASRVGAPVQDEESARVSLRYEV